ncbi:response regulator [Streptomyces sp. SUK 48]|uniref:response regulator n=2 Tax=Streptomyces TaxID=1883 RepID=UPI000DC4D725|nr:response regulator [Streptomyces sp. SUK 48]RAJ63587.1 response regulator receiver domain-containing protein [Streptomyces sp. PsTaAH-130]
MPGIHFSLRMTDDEIAAITTREVDELVTHLVSEMCVLQRGPVEYTREQATALAHLHLLTHLKRAVDELEAEAAHWAADAGAGYPQIGRASNMTRQGARRRWPGLLDQQPRPPRNREYPMMTAPARPYDVLLVEDDEADALLIEDALLARGARNLTQVHDGVAGLAYLRDPANPRPDLIVLDLNMPRMNGRELLTVIKDDAGLRTIPVVVLTTSSAPDDVSSAYQKHANAYVTKPVNLDDFERAVQSIDAFYLETVTRLPRT